MPDRKHLERRRRRDRAGRSRPRRAAAPDGATYWIYGLHAAAAALANPARRTRKLVATAEALETLEREVGAAALGGADLAKRDAVARLLPRHAVHQGVALEVWPLTAPRFDDVLALDPDRPRPGIALLLDRVSDPRNVGAVLRAAAAFGVRAVVATERHAPGETGALAKAASGGLDLVPYLRVTNLARALVLLGEMGYWRIGLDAAAEARLEAARGHRDIAVVLGAEGSGMRALTRQRTDQTMRIEMPAAPSMPSLNVANAAAIALYALARPAGEGWSADAPPA